MAPELGSTRHKRTRAQQGDEVSSSLPKPELLPSAKKRRLHGTTSSSAAPATGLSAIASAIGSVFGYGRRSNANPAYSRNKQDKTSRSAYDDIPDSGDEVLVVSPRKKPMRAAVSYAKLNQKLAKAPKQPSKDLYDVPDSDDELEFSTPMGGQANTPLKTKQNSALVKGSNGKAGRIRLEDVEDSTSEEPQGTPSQNQAKRTASVTVSEKKGQKSQPGRKLTVEAPPPPQTSSIQNKSPTKQAPPTPKGILTPRHKRPGRPRKNVAFDSEDNKPAEVYFDDLPTKSKFQALHLPAARLAGKPQTKRQADLASAEGNEEGQDEDEDSADDEVCVVCSKPDSQRGNEIVFCDNCNKAFHQKCYNVLDIPADDWFCKDCLQEDVTPDIVEDAKQVAGTLLTVPDILNFEQHLRTMQRALIDRCSGVRRLKLKGQEDAYEKTYQLVEQTVMAGEGNSMMIIGARGCGKTLLVESVVSDLAVESQDTFHVVRLNGFIHTDDKLALKEIWRQLGKEMEVEDDLVTKASFPNTRVGVFSWCDYANLCTDKQLCRHTSFTSGIALSPIRDLRN